MMSDCFLDAKQRTSDDGGERRVRGRAKRCACGRVHGLTRSLIFSWISPVGRQAIRAITTAEREHVFVSGREG